MPKAKTKLIAILMAFILSLTFIVTAHASPQELSVHTLESGTPTDNASYEILSFHGAILSFTQTSTGQYSAGGSLTTLTSSGGSLTIAGLPVGTYTVQQKSVSSGYSPSTPSSQNVYVSATGATDAYFSIALSTPTPTPTPVPTPTPSPTPTPVTTGSIRIVHSDSQTGESIENAVFSIYDATGGKLQDVTSNFLGEAVVANLAVGRYAIVQTKASDGYALDKTKYVANVSAGNESSIEIKNAQTTGTLTVTVLDSSGKKLSGCTLTIYKMDGTKVTDITSDSNGEAIATNLSRGNYYLQQTKAPENHEISSEKQNFTIGKEPVSLEVKSKTLTGSISISVTAKESKQNVSGVVFGIYRDNDEKVAEITTGNDGYTNLSSLAYGDYYYTMIKAPAEYALQTARQSFKVGKDKTSVNVTLDLALGKVKIIKTSTAGTAIASSSYELIDSTGKVVATLTTNKDGTVTSENIPCGTYTLKESKAGTGYKLSTAVHTVTITADKTNEINIVGDGKSGSLIVLFKHTSDEREVAKKQVYTDVIGTDYMVWINENKLDKKELKGYQFVRADYPSETTLIDGALTITYWYSGNGSLTITDDKVDEGTTEVEIVDDNEIVATESQASTASTATSTDQTSTSQSDSTDLETKPVKAPQTGDKQAKIVPFILLSALFVTGLFFCLKHKKPSDPVD